MKIKPRSCFLAKLVLFSTGAHGIFLVFLFLYPQQSPIKLTISGRATEINWAEVEIVPLVKSMPLKKTVEKLRSQPISVEKKIIPKKLKGSKSEQTKSAMQMVQAKIAPKQEKKEKALPQQLQKKAEPAVAPIIAPEKICIGRNDKELLEMQQELYAQLAQHWVPPVGTPVDAKCSIKATIAQDGSVANLVMSKSSTIMIFDIAARTAIVQTAFPESVWGKEVVITFN